MANDTMIPIVGNLTDDPELRYLSSGAAMAKFRIASTPRVYDKAANEWRDGDALFMPCTAWRDLAEHIAESLTRGARVVVYGRLRQSHWEDKETGEKRSMIQLDVEDIGPSLRYATAQVRKANRSNGRTGNGTAPHDEWATASPTRPADTDTGGFDDDKPPF